MAKLKVWKKEDSKIFVYQVELGSYSVAVEATNHIVNDDVLSLFIETKEGTENIAVFKDWSYFKRREKTFEEKLEGIKQIAKPGDLPEGWGKINGVDF